MKLSSRLLTIPAILALSVAGATTAIAADTNQAPTNDGPTVYDPSTLTRATSGDGLFTPEGVNVCAENPEHVLGPDGTLLCFTGVIAGPETTSSPGPRGEEPTQVGQIPVGGADTGVMTRSTPTPASAPALGGLALTSVAAAGAYLLMRRRTGQPGN